MNRLLVLSLLNLSVYGSELRNVTGEVFGDDDNLSFFPVAFGDFNSDKLTDIFALDFSKSQVSILLAREQTFSSVFKGNTYFDTNQKKKLACTINNAEIVSVSPADFDGDGGMDLMLTVKKEEEENLVAFVLWGEHDQKAKVHTLKCPEESMEKGWHHKIQLESQPLVIDANGDYVADIFAAPLRSTTNHSRGLWIYTDDRSQPPAFVPLNIKESEHEEPLSNPHSSAFVDLDGDGNADLLVTAETRFELWLNTGGGLGGSSEAAHFKHTKSIKKPLASEKDLIGQVSVSDFDLDGNLDLLFPVCHAEAGSEASECANATMYGTSLLEMWKSGFTFQPLFVDMSDWRFNFEADADCCGPYEAVTARMGDINLDGYPDLLLRMKSLGSLKKQTHVLLNVARGENNKRGFLLQPQIMEGLEDTVMAAFYDLYENGLEDVILVQKINKDKFRVGAFINQTEGSDAYFVKVIVLSGKCYRDCSGDGIQVPYGTNIPGQTICYRTQRPGLEQSFSEIESCAPQLTQTAHSALQLPYTIFGLGLAPNFLDYMFVNVTNATAKSRSHTWPQIIPNSQMYVIPHPPTQPGRWEAKLFITPSRGITLTGLALVGTCGLVILIIVVLYWRERRADHWEKLQEAHRFHFDAM